MAGGFEIPLQEHLVRTKGGGGLALGRDHGIGEISRCTHEAHAAAASAGRRLDEKGVPDTCRRRLQRGIAGPALHRCAWQYGHSGPGHQFLGPRLVPHERMALRRRPDPDDARRRAGLGQHRVLGEEAVARMESIGAGTLGRTDESGRRQIGLGERRSGEQHRDVSLSDMGARRVVSRIDRDSLAAGMVRAAYETPGDFAPVGHEQTPDHQCRTTPKTAVPRTSAEWTAVSAMASTVRVPADR